jgi:predicted DNA-binding transcriptional regulator YafY
MQNILQFSDRIVGYTCRMELLIRQAIKERIVVQFMYEGKKETIEPYVLGCEKNSLTVVLLGYRILASEKDHPWKLFSFENISELTLIDLKAYSYRSGIARNLNKIRTIICKG